MKNYRLINLHDYTCEIDRFIDFHVCGDEVKIVLRTRTGDEVITLTATRVGARMVWDEHVTAGWVRIPYRTPSSNTVIL